MPELPEVETVCRTLSPVLAGKTISGFELRWPRTLAQPDLSEFGAAVTGSTVLGVDRRAKLILIHLSRGGALSVHLRMTGELLYLPTGAEADPSRSSYLRAAFLFSDRSELLFYDTRKFGRISYLGDDQLKRLDTLFGVEPLGIGFSSAWLFENLHRRKRQLKPLLLDQSFIAGLGNIYVDEALFLAYLHPLRRSNTVSFQQAEDLHRAIVETLIGALARRGTTLRDYRSGLGEFGDNRSSLQVYGSKPGSPCPRCRTALERLIVGQRGSIYCPACQPLSIP